ncbi:hypothetical protein [Pseudonocardia endophytica]|uniref:Uncharacterized protein n=1 Tax=Pseudonocardia endophytica TaxID=401976 RepID=A0A4R1I5A0_PSEEN|nr:hypothetical protein [Pseudonocardia endophytica]TCK25202.1 hypothetical protein EV378_1002 [Pseudonocardia endophytica]
MRPTIDEQLGGAARLLRLAEDDPEITPEIAELVRNARRLVQRVEGSWSQALPFLVQDNASTAALLGEDEPGEETGLAGAAARNEDLRASLTSRIHELPDGPDRAAIGAHLRARVAADPT